MPMFVVDLQDLDRTRAAEGGGKGANLGELTSRVPVPPGFCVTTAAWDAVVGSALDAQIARLDGPDAGPAEIAAVRDALRALPWPEALTREVRARVEPGVAHAVRSSATAEDLPDASFAGQHDSSLHVVGADAVLEHVRRCWASLYTDRAVAYRRQQGVPHRTVAMAVVVQRQLEPEVAGVLFTADPVSGDRRTCVVEAVPGLAEGLVSGRAAPETARIRDGAVLASCALLTDLQLVELEALGRRIEAHLGAPQDIEWCLVDGRFHVVQSRPITTLYPLPALPEGPRVLLSVGHQQMMTDAMKPLGWSVFQATSAGRMGMLEAGGRLFVDATAQLLAPATRDGLLAMLDRADPFTRDALGTVLGRGFLPITPSDPDAPVIPWGPPAADPDPALVPALIARSDAALEAARSRLDGLTGLALLDAVDADLQDLRAAITDPQNMVAIVAGMNATNWLNTHLADWLGEVAAADVLSRSAPGNVTSAMGLALLDVADVVRPFPAVQAVFREATAADVWARLDAVEGGPAARAALEAFLDRYGARCPGEIDITRPRWAEDPTALLPVILGHVARSTPGEAARRFVDGEEQAAAYETRVLARLAALPDGEGKVAQTAAQIRRLRAFVGYREFPKYAIVRRFLVIKRALTAEAARLVDAGVLAGVADLHFLTLPELREVTRTGAVDRGLLAARRQEHARNQRLTPPRVMTSDGACLSGAFRREGLPAGALVGLGVSAGVVEGRARVVLDLADAALEPGDILVTRFTDPSWTPRFVAVAGLVTEVGGLMTHGAVIAREYGLPAVVSVEGATTRIADGQRIRVDGAAGTVERLDPP